MVRNNQPIAEWVLNPDNYKNGLRLLGINGMQIPIIRPVCEVCTDMKCYKKINTYSDKEITKLTHQGKLHGLSRPLSVYENRVYHKPCLIKKLGQKKFDELVTEGIIITE